MPTTIDAAELAEHAITQHENAKTLLAELTGREMDLQADRHSAKHAAIVRLMQETNLLTQKQHSASSAEQVCESDLAYREYLRELSEIVVAKITAEGQAEGARLRALLALSLLDTRTAA